MRLEQILGYQPNPLFLEMLSREKRVRKFGLPWEKHNERRFMPDPGVMSLLGSSFPPSGNVGADIASAATITISSAVHKLTGTTQVTLVKVPTGFRGVFALIPTGVGSTATGGTYAASDGTVESIPFALASTTAVSKMLLLFCNGLLLYPSY